MSRIVTPTGTRRLAGGEESDAAIHATGELATALAHIHRDTLLGSELARIADTFDRAPHQVVPNRMGSVSGELRACARELGLVADLTGVGRAKAATAQLILALGSLLAEIRAYHYSKGRLHQSHATHHAHQFFPNRRQRRSISQCSPASTGSRIPPRLDQATRHARPEHGPPRPRGRA